MFLESRRPGKRSRTARCTAPNKINNPPGKERGMNRSNWESKVERAAEASARASDVQAWKQSIQECRDDEGAITEVLVQLLLGWQRGQISKPVVDNVLSSRPMLVSLKKASERVKRLMEEKPSFRGRK